MRGLVAAMLLFAPGCVGLAHARDLTFRGYARDLRSGALLYVESHAVHAAGSSSESRVVLYLCPRGEPFARKELHYGAARAEPEFSFSDARFGYLEGLRRHGAALEVFQKPGPAEALRVRPLAADSGIVADAGFDEFVQQHWAELEAGHSVRFPFLVPSRLDYLTFRVRKHGDAMIEGADASVIRLNLAGFLGWFLPYIEVSYRKSDRVLLRYKGLTNVWDERRDNLTAQIDFPPQERRETTADLDSARAAGLVSRCP